MNDIEQKALALLNEVSLYKCENVDTAPHEDLCVAFRRAIDQHEAFRREVSDAVTALLDCFLSDGLSQGVINGHLHQFIIRKPKPDPLVEIMEGLDGEWTPEDYAKEIRAALEARGFEIKEKNDDR